MGWKPGINPSYLFFLFGEIYLFGMKLGIIFFFYLGSLWKAYWGTCLETCCLLASIEFSPLPSFIKEQDVLMSDWEYIHGLDIFTLFLPSHVTFIY